MPRADCVWILCMDCGAERQQVATTTWSGLWLNASLHCQVENAINTHMSVYGFIGHIRHIYPRSSNNNNRWHNLMRVEKIIISSASDFYRQPSSNMQTTCASGWMDGWVGWVVWVAHSPLYISPGDIFVVKEFHPSSAFLRHGNRRIIYNCQRNCPGPDCRPLIYGIS